MQISVMVLCKEGTSLRTAISNDEKGLEKYDLRVSETRRRDRWGPAKIHCNIDRGALNIFWNAKQKALLCHAVTKKTNMPGKIVGQFISYLLNCHKVQVRDIVVRYISK